MYRLRRSLGKASRGLGSSKAKRAAAVMTVVVLGAGTAAAVERLGTRAEPALLMEMAGPEGPAAALAKASTTSTSTLPATSSSTSATPPVAAPAVPKTSTPTTRRTVAAPATPSTTLPPPPTSSSPCPGIAPVINDYGVYLADRSGAALRVGGGEDVKVKQMTWSPDGTMLAFSTWKGNLGGTGAITVVGRHGLDARVVASGPYLWTVFAWTVDSREVVFANRDTSTTPSTDTLIAADVDGSLGRTLVSKRDSLLSPIGGLGDGRRILFSSFAGLSVVNLDGSGERVVAGGAAGGSLSPDRRFYAFLRNSALNVVDLEAERFVVESPGTANPHPGGPIRWSPDSALVAYAAADPPPFHLVVARSNGEVVRTIPEITTEFRFSPEGDAIAVGTVNHGVDVYDLPGDGRRPGFAMALFLDWAPNSSLAGVQYFVDHPEDSPDGTAAVCLVEPGKSAPRRLITFLGRTVGSRIQWSPDGTALAIKVGL